MPRVAEVGLDAVVGAGQRSVIVVAGLPGWSTAVGRHVGPRVVVVETPVADVARVRERIAEHPQQGALLDQGRVLVAVDGVGVVEVDHRLQRDLAVLQELGDLLQQQRTDALGPRHPSTAPLRARSLTWTCSVAGSFLGFGRATGVESAPAGSLAASRKAAAAWGLLSSSTALVSSSPRLISWRSSSERLVVDRVGDLAHRGVEPQGSAGRQPDVTRRVAGSPSAASMASPGRA